MLDLRLCRIVGWCRKVCWRVVECCCKVCSVTLTERVVYGSCFNKLDIKFASRIVLKLCDVNCNGCSCYVQCVRPTATSAHRAIEQPYATLDNVFLDMDVPQVVNASVSPMEYCSLFLLQVVVYLFNFHKHCKSAHSHATYCSFIHLIS